jgi:Sec-independent protein translocase protein TatA
MAQARTSTCLVFLIAALGLAVFCWAGPHEIAKAAQAHGGIVGGLVGQLKREDDEAEVQQIREHQPATREDREEAHEQAEQVAMQVAQQREGEGEGS